MDDIEAWEDEPLADAAEDAEEKKSIAPASYMADHPRRADFLYAIVTGLLVTALNLLWRYPCAHPKDWADLAIAAGLRPPYALCPGVWRAIVHPLFRHLSFDDTLLVLRVGGIAVASLTAMLTYLLIREVLAITVRQFSRTLAWRNVVAPLVSFVGAVVLACGEPVWTAGQSFSPAGFFLLELVSAAFLLSRYARLGGFWRLAVSMLLFGFLSGEYATGILLTAGALVALWQVLKTARIVHLPLADLHEEGIPATLSALFWLLGAMASCFISIQSFIATGGLRVWEWSTKTLPLRYAISYVLSTLSSANLFGWIGFAALAVAPLVLAARHFQDGVDDDHPVRDVAFATLGVTFIFALSQLSMVFQAWYWRWSEQVAVASSPLLCLSAFLSTGTLVLALAVFGFNFSCRMPTGEAPKRQSNPFFLSAVAVVLIVTVPGRYGPMRRAALGVVRDYVREVARECGGVKWVFTDGALDEGVELASLRFGRPVNALPMVAGAGPRERYIRLRGAGGEEERIALRDGASATLKTWKRDFPPNLTNSAVQIGFEVWRQAREPLPACSGLLARPAGFPSGEAERGIHVAHDLAERTLDLCERNIFGGTPDTFVEEKLIQVLWRLARMTQTRAVSADLAGDSATALREIDFAEELDKANPALRRLNARIAKAGLNALRTMSPREHLRQALQRADFTAAKPYADAVLATDPGNADANFAIGMFYFADEIYSKAEIYLERCTRQRPDEPTFFNNLAIAQLMTRKLDLAEKNAKRALELLPDSPEVKDTVRQVEKARQAAMR